MWCLPSIDYKDIGTLESTALYFAWNCLSWSNWARVKGGMTEMDIRNRNGGNDGNGYISISTDLQAELPSKHMSP